MPTYIKLAQGDSLTVDEDDRQVYEKLLAAGWREPCEFTETAQDAPRPVTLNPAFLVLFRPV